MKAFLLALATAAAWGFGGYFEKKGLHASALSPQVGAALRTAVALVVLGFASGPALRQLGAVPVRSLGSIALGGGVAAGAIGILCFYAALRAAPIQQVMPIAFTSPLFAALAAVALGGESISGRTALGMALTVAGIAVIGSGR
jgi:transporter family protein